MTATVPTIGLWYDMRNPEQWKQPFGALYRDTVDQAVWAEKLGFGSAWFSEHHFADDGYCSSPLTLCAAVGSRTSTMRVGTNILVAALHDPVRLAEDSAALALITEDRFELGVAIGYHAREFEAMGRNIKQRPSLLEDSIAVIKHAWSTDGAPHEGKRYSSPALSVTPKPERAPRLVIGGMSPVSVERAALVADGLITVSNVACEWYVDALEKLGKPASEGRVYAAQWVVIAEDPEKVWAEGLGEKALNQINDYITWGAFDGPEGRPPLIPDTDALLASGFYRTLDAAAAIDDFVQLVTDFPQVKDIHYWAQLPGESVESGSERLQYVADHVIPEVTRRLLSKVPA